MGRLVLWFFVLLSMGSSDVESNQTNSTGTGYVNVQDASFQGVIGVANETNSSSAALKGLLEKILDEKLANLATKDEIADLRHEVADISSTLTSLATKVDLNWTRDVLRGSLAVDLARLTSVHIVMIAPWNRSMGFVGCGGYVCHAKKCYVATARHVVEDNNTQLLVHVLKLIDGTRLRPKKAKFSIPPFYDMALIEVHCLPRRANLTLSTREPVLGEELIGVSYLETGIVFLRCHVVERFHVNVSGQFFPLLYTDCGGYKGSSGTSYLGQEGPLMAIHCGSARYKHSGNTSLLRGSPMEETGYAPDWDSTRDTLKQALNGSAFNETQFDLGFVDLENIVEASSRNPRALAAPVVELLNFLRVGP